MTIARFATQPRHELHFAPTQWSLSRAPRAQSRWHVFLPLKYLGQTYDWRRAPFLLIYVTFLFPLDFFFFSDWRHLTPGVEIWAPYRVVGGLFLAFCFFCPSPISSIQSPTVQLWHPGNSTNVINLPLMNVSKTWSSSMRCRQPVYQNELLVLGGHLAMFRLRPQCKPHRCIDIKQIVCLWNQFVAHLNTVKLENVVSGSALLGTGPSNTYLYILDSYTPNIYIANSSVNKKLGHRTFRISANIQCSSPSDDVKQLTFWAYLESGY